MADMAVEEVPTSINSEVKFSTKNSTVKNTVSPEIENNLEVIVSENNAQDQNNLINNEVRKLSTDKRVRFSEKVENGDELEDETNDLSLQSAVTRETKVVWEMIAEGQKEAVKWPHKDSTASTDSVFIHDHEEEVLKSKMVTDLDDEDQNPVMKGGHVFRSLLEERKLEKVSIPELLGDGGYGSLEAGGGAGVVAGAAHPPHSCGSLFGQCGARRGPDHSLVTTFSHGRLRHVDVDEGAEDTYSGPVSLTEILQERDPGRMCRMGNGVSNLGKGGDRAPEGASAGAAAGVSMVAVLRKEVKQWEDRSVELGEEVAELRKEVKRKDHEILRLQREVHKLKVGLGLKKK